MSSRDTSNRGSKPLDSASAAGTVARTVRLLAALADSGKSAGVGTLAETTGLPASTVHRLLGLLVDEGIVDRNPDSHNYSVGPELYRIAARIVDTVDIIRVIQPHLQRLADQFDETVLFGQYSAANRSLAFLARADGQQLLQYRIELNRPLSVIWGASGKAVLAYLPYDDVSSIIEHERAFPGAGRAPGNDGVLPSRADLETSLEQVRQDGFAVSEGEKLPQARGIGVPVFGPRRLLGSITLTSPKDRMPHGEIVKIAEALQITADNISADLGTSKTTRASRLVNGSRPRTTQLQTS